MAIGKHTELIERHREVIEKYDDLPLEGRRSTYHAEIRSLKSGEVEFSEMTAVEVIAMASGFRNLHRIDHTSEVRAFEEHAVIGDNQVLLYYVLGSDADVEKI